MVIPADDIKKKIEDKDKEAESTIDSKLESSDDGHVQISNSDLPGGKMSDELYSKYEKAGYDVNRNDNYVDIKPR